MSSELNVGKGPETMFMQCHAHELNLVLLHFAQCISDCKAFIKDWRDEKRILCKSIKRIYLLIKVVKGRCQGHHPKKELIF